MQWFHWSGPLQIKYAWSGPGTETSLTLVIYTLKPKHFSEDSDIADESFKNLLKKLADMDHEAFVAENFGDD